MRTLSSNLRRRLASNAGVRCLTLCLLALALSGCATFRSYDQELSGTLSRAQSGDVDGAIRALRGERKGKDSDLLYNLELGELLRLKRSFDASEEAWIKADQTVLAWENIARNAPQKLLPSVSGYFINDKLRAYEGRDYEKVMLTTRLALNHLAMGDFAKARVAIKRTHERETLIAGIREKEVAEVEEQAKKKGAKTSFKDLGGYPTQTLDNPEVNALRNSYQSAFSHYLAGFVYEALGEPSLAAAGYRQAAELKPNVPIIEEGLAGLDRRAAAHSDQDTDVLFVIETGEVPGRQSSQFVLPIPSNFNWVFVPVSFPVMSPRNLGVAPLDLQVQGLDPLPVSVITDVDAMARRALKDEMPSIMLRSAVRSTIKGFAQSQARHQDKSGLSLLAVTLGALLTESADERGWRTLPGLVSVARGRLPRGEHQVSLNSPNGARTFTLQVFGRHMVVAVRLLAGNLFVLAPAIAVPSGQALSPVKASQKWRPS